MWQFDEIETPLDAIQPRFDSINAAVYPCDRQFNLSNSFFNRSHPNFQVANILYDTIELRIETPQIFEDEVIGRVHHPILYSAATPKSFSGSRCGLAAY